jgi:hypothetical protein
MTTARIAGGFYLVTFVTGSMSLFVSGRLGFAASLIAAISYVAVTVLFYGLFRPVNRNLSLVAAAVSLGGCAMAALKLFDLAPFHVHPLVFFGFYCLLIGYLILRSTFLPRVLGALMASGGVGWLTFLSASVAGSLSPYNMFPGILGEGALTVWLVLMGVDEQRWKEQASPAGNA